MEVHQVLIVKDNVMKKEIYDKIKANIELNKIKFIDKPYTRFKGTEFEPKTSISSLK